MSLTNCPACQHQISEAAWKCPSCGHPLRSVGWHFFKYAIAAAFAFLAIWFLWWSYSVQQDEINGPIRVHTAADK